MSTQAYHTLIPLFEELRGKRVLVRPYCESDAALDSLHANRLEIRCDELNERSAAVPKRLEYVLEGRLRNHLTTSDGRMRTTLIFSFIPTDRQ